MLLNLYSIEAVAMALLGHCCTISLLQINTLPSPLFRFFEMYVAFQGSSFRIYFTKIGRY